MSYETFLIIAVSVTFVISNLIMFIIFKRAIKQMKQIQNQFLNRMEQSHSDAKEQVERLLADMDNNENKQQSSQ